MDQPNQQFPFVLMPQLPWQQLSQQVQSRGPIVPPRVQIAMEFLRRLTDKTATIAMPTYSSERVEFTPIDGQRLSDEEANAQATACNLLSQYFAGQLSRSEWDDSEIQSSNLHNLKVKCPACRSNPIHVTMCEICGGVGEVMVVRADAAVRAKRDKK